MWTNQTARVVQDFGPDPRNPFLGVATDAWRRLQDAIVPAMGDQSAVNYNGPLPTMQHFEGAAGLIGATNIYRNGGSATVESTSSTDSVLGDPIRRVFAARMARGASS